MQRYILEQNLLLFRKALAQPIGDRERQSLQSLIASTQRELALLISKTLGAQEHEFSPRFRVHGGGSAAFADKLQSASTASLLIDPRSGLHIVDVNPAYAQATLIDRYRAVGQRMFEIFPDNPDDAGADGVYNLHRSLQIVAQTGETHEMSLQRYDIRNENGEFIQRFWRAWNVPLFDENARLRFILHQAEDVTEEVLEGALSALA